MVIGNIHRFCEYCLDPLVCSRSLYIFAFQSISSLFQKCVHLIRHLSLYYHHISFKVIGNKKNNIIIIGYNSYPGIIYAQ
jgi:hypothetical protein